MNIEYNNCSLFYFYLQTLLFFRINGPYATFGDISELFQALGANRFHDLTGFAGRQGFRQAVRQRYKDAALKTSANKVLVLVKRDGKWLIQQERVGN